MLKNVIWLAPAFWYVATGALNANAGVVTPSSQAISISNFPYERGTWEGQMLAGAFWDPGLYDKRPRFDYALQSARVGIMVTNLTGGGLFRGNLEFLVEAMGGEFFNGPATYLVGGNLFLRWNFVRNPNPKWTPYIQIGGGGLYHDANTSGQDVLGSNTEAMLIGGFGLHYRINEKWAFTQEITYRHISNAGTTDGNRGLNSAGGQLGLSYFFH